MAKTSAKISMSLKKLYPPKPPRECVVCKQSFIHKKRKTCSDECLYKFKVAQGKRTGPAAGRASQAAQPRRSKGETLFCNLCINFGKENVLSNAQIFTDKNGNKWDADIVITNARIAVCYNGIYHYQKVAAQHYLKQVQSRDAIKKRIIFDNQYIQYIVKDMGRFNVSFVYKEFHQFIFRTFGLLELKMLSDF
jgi:hypothetical protein